MGWLGDAINPLNAFGPLGWGAKDVLEGKDPKKRYDDLGKSLGGGGGAIAPINPYQATSINMERALADEPNEGMRNTQLNFIDALQAQSQGRGVNLGHQQFQNALAKSIQTQRSAAMSQRGVNPALAGKMAADMGMQMQAQGAGQSALLDMQNQLNAQSQLGGALSGVRQQDLAKMQMINQARQAQNQLDVSQNLGIQGINANSSDNAQRIAAGQAMGDKQASNQMTGSLIGAGASLLPLLMSGGAAAAPMMAAGGGLIHGYGMGGMQNSPGNDSVPAMLSPGEVVLPKSIVNSDDPGEKAKAFVEAIKRHTGKASYGRVIAAKRKASDE